jgi:16S rRNA (cytosine967-C5)-methyltransferase
MPISPARTAAYDILLRIEQEDSYASELLHSARCAELSSPDQGLATELVMGVLRWRSALDSAIEAVSTQRLEKLDRQVLIALRLGAYQLNWLDRVPARAAIHESVELVKRARKRSAAPFANAVLRKLADSPARSEAYLSAVASSITANELAAASAHPGWLISRWISQFGIVRARNICLYNQSVPVTVFRLRFASVEEELRQEGIELTGGRFLASARRVCSGDVTKTDALRDGRLVIQDEASQLVAALVGQGKRILDCCAAPGGKTWAIADRNPNAKIVAAELHSHRADLLRKRVRAHNVEVVTTDVHMLPIQELYDRVLVDVPCSGTGTLARNPEIKWRLASTDLDDLRSRQIAILNSAMRQVASGGRLIYSTCSLESEEDELVVEEALRQNDMFQLVDCRTELDLLRAQGDWVAGDSSSFLQGPYLRTIPGIHPCDGFFVAILERR